VKDGSKSATCSVATTSPPLVEYRVGDRVTVVCKRTGDRWTLTAIRKVATKPKTDQPAPKAPPTDTTLKQGGTLTVVAATSVTVRDGDRDFVCKLGDASPPLDGFHVGDHVVIVCKGGALVGITRVDVPSPKTPVVERTGQGSITALSASSVTVHTDGGDVTCALGDGSPKLGDYKVGDLVKFGCRNDVLTGIYKSVPPTPAPVYRSGQGTLTVLTTTGVTVRTDGGDVSCTLRDASPKLGDFHVGDRVKFYCTNDVLSGIAHL
jgi:hypothetical protein